MKNDPAELVLVAMGGLTALARALRKDVSTVFRWRLPRNKGGADGRVPAKNFFPIWCALVQKGEPMTLEELVFTSGERDIINEIRRKYSENQNVVHSLQHADPRLLHQPSQVLGSSSVSIDNDNIGDSR